MLVNKIMRFQDDYSDVGDSNKNQIKTNVKMSVFKHQTEIKYTRLNTNRSFKHQTSTVTHV